MSAFRKATHRKGMLRLGRMSCAHLPAKADPKRKNHSEASFRLRLTHSLPSIYPLPTAFRAMLALRPSVITFWRRGTSLVHARQIAIPAEWPAAPAFSWRSVGASVVFPNWYGLPAGTSPTPLERVREVMSRTPAAGTGLAPSQPEDNSNSAVWQSSTVKKRAMKMNKHKLKKRRKLLRMNTKQSRG